MSSQQWRPCRDHPRSLCAVVRVRGCAVRHDVRATASGVWMDAQRRGADPVCRRSACESVHGGVSRALLLDVLREALALELTCRHRRFVRAVRWVTRGLVLRRILPSWNARALAWRWGGSGRCVRPVAPGVVMTAVKVECACLAPETWAGDRLYISKRCTNTKSTPPLPGVVLVHPARVQLAVSCHRAAKLSATRPVVTMPAMMLSL